MTNRDFGRKTVTKAQKMLGVKIINSRNINSKPDVAKAIVKICEGYARKQLTLLENSGVVVAPVEKSQLNLYESLARETKKQNEALTEKNEILKKDLENYKSIAKNNRDKAIQYQNHYNDLSDRYYKMAGEQIELFKQLNKSKFYLEIMAGIIVFITLLLLIDWWW